MDITFLAHVNAVADLVKQRSTDQLFGVLGNQESGCGGGGGGGGVGGEGEEGEEEGGDEEEGRVETSGERAKRRQECGLCAHVQEGQERAATNGYRGIKEATKCWEGKEGRGRQGTLWQGTGRLPSSRPRRRCGTRWARGRGRGAITEIIDTSSTGASGVVTGASINQGDDGGGGNGGDGYEKAASGQFGGKEYEQLDERGH